MKKLIFLGLVLLCFNGILYAERRFGLTKIRTDMTSVMASSGSAVEMDYTVTSGTNTSITVGSITVSDIQQNTGSTYSGSTVVVTNIDVSSVTAKQIKTENFRMTTGASADRVLTSDANGNSRWAAAAGGVTVTTNTPSFVIGDGDIYLSSNTFAGNGNFAVIDKTTWTIVDIRFFTQVISTVTVTPGANNHSCSFNIAWSTNTTGVETNYNYMFSGTSVTIMAGQQYSVRTIPTKFLINTFPCALSFHTLQINDNGTTPQPAGYGVIISYSRQTSE